MSETKDWSKICADCQEGNFPEHCEYFGEPGGCNAPTMGKHPTSKESLEVGDMAQMREALEKLLHGEYKDRCEVTQIAHAALSAPPRNCDRCLTPKDAMLAHLEEVYEGEKVEFGDYEWCEFVKWLFAEAKGETND